jgi:hypothetical protein
LTANTLKVWSTLGVRFDTVIKRRVFEVAPTLDHESEPATFISTRYSVIGLPPLSAGDHQDTDAVVYPMLALTNRGSLGALIERGERVTMFDGAPPPTELTATTRN